jgi:hypothetical protein
MEVLTSSAANLRWTLHEILLLRCRLRRQLRGALRWNLGWRGLLDCAATFSFQLLGSHESYWINILLQGGFEILGEFLALTKRKSSLLIDLDDLDVLVLPSKHEVLTQLVGIITVGVPQSRVLLELLDPVRVPERVQGGLTAGESW